MSPGEPAAPPLAEPPLAEPPLAEPPAVRVPVERLPHAADLPLPAYASPGAAGLDLLAALPEGAPLTLRPLERALVPTGLRIALPPGFEAQVRPRSGLALRHGLTVLNAPGTIDSDYRGEIGVILVNLGAEPVTIRRGERIAQLVLAAVPPLLWEERPVGTGETARGAGGFGSTGRDGATVSPTAAATDPSRPPSAAVQTASGPSGFGSTGRAASPAAPTGPATDPSRLPSAAAGGFASTGGTAPPVADAAAGTDPSRRGLAGSAAPPGRPGAAAGAAAAASAAPDRGAVG